MNFGGKCGILEFIIFLFFEEILFVLLVDLFYDMSWSKKFGDSFFVLVIFMVGFLDLFWIMGFEISEFLFFKKVVMGIFDVFMVFFKFLF